MTRQPWMLLTTEDHARDSAGMRYVYPVLSRRAGGVSVGINLNPNNACNWQCIYCQVPGLKRGGPPPIDLALLERELATLLDAIHSGQFIINQSSPDVRTMIDVAFSGNGEPTSAAEFPAAVAIAQRVLVARGLAGQVKLRLITNGSLLDRRTVQEGVALLGKATGEVWFKIDTASVAGLAQINGTRTSPQAVVRRLARCTALAPTWVQTCLFLLDKQPPAEAEIAAYLALLAPLAPQLEGVHLYGLARPSLQKTAPRLSRMEAGDLENIAQRIRQLGLIVHVSP